MRGNLALLVLWIFLPWGGASAGTCVNYQDGEYTVMACEDGSYTVMDRHGHRRVYGTPNAGFERFPGQGERGIAPVYRRRED